MSILGMMEQGNLLTKIIFTGFLNLLVFKPHKPWIYHSILFLISVILMHFFKYNNMVHQYALNNKIANVVLQIIIGLWMIYISYVIGFQLYDKVLKK